jgi:hypothetical protein
MCMLPNLTLTELNSMTKAQLVSAAVKDVRHVTTDLIQDPDLGNTQLDEITKDAYGTVLSKRTIVWSYYPTQEIQEITVTEKDPEDKTTEEYIITHYLDGRQPVINHSQVVGKLGREKAT